jgi:hypothetical protein
MRRPTRALLATVLFWTTYVISAAYVLYEETPPLGRVLMLVLGGYAAILSVLTVVLLRRTPPTHPAAGAGRKPARPWPSRADTPDLEAGAGLSAGMDQTGTVYPLAPRPRLERSECSTG